MKRSKLLSAVLLTLCTSVIFTGCGSQNSGNQNNDTQNSDTQNSDTQNSDTQSGDAQNSDAQNSDAEKSDSESGSKSGLCGRNTVKSAFRQAALPSRVAVRSSFALAKCLSMYSSRMGLTR